MPDESPIPEMCVERAREIDRTIVDLTRRGTTNQMLMSRLMYEMSSGGFRHLGYPSFWQYLKSRNISTRTGSLRAGVYRRFCVELLIPEQRLSSIPIGRLQGVLGLASSANVDRLLTEAAQMPQGTFQEHLRTLRGEGRAPVRGTYQLVPRDPTSPVKKGSRRTIRGSVFSDEEGTLFVQFR